MEREKERLIGTGRCPVAGCGVKIFSARLMCAKHWSQATEELRAAVWDAYDGWKRGEVSLADLRRVQGQAVAAVEAMG